MKAPFIPQNAPFSDTQRAWLGGFFAGMHSHMLQSAGSVNQANARTLHILYGTQTGNSESLANDAANAAKKHGLQPVVKSMDEVEIGQLPQMQYLLIVTSTYGEGAMPDNAEMLWEAANSDAAPRLDNVNYSVLALGDTSYDLFCQAGIDWDNKLAALGAKRVFDRVDCDVDFEAPAEKWLSEVIPLMAEGASTIAVVDTETQAAKSVYNRKKPIPSQNARQPHCHGIGFVERNSALRNFYQWLRPQLRSRRRIVRDPDQLPGLGSANRQSHRLHRRGRRTGQWRINEAVGCVAHTFRDQITQQRTD